MKGKSKLLGRRSVLFGSMASVLSDRLLCETANPRMYRSSEIEGSDYALTGIKNVRDYGVVGDSVTDDTAALQKLFDSLEANDVVEFSKGIFVVKPVDPGRYVLELPDLPGITIQGLSRSASSIKIADASGNYLGLLGRRNGVNLSRLTIKHLTLDHNQKNNKLLNKGEYTSLGRYSIGLYGPAAPDADHEFTDLDVVNCDSVVSIYIPQGKIRNASIVIKNCRWLDLTNAAGIDYDQSIINVAGDQVIISENIFRGESWGKGMPRTAIETHASNQIIVGNTVKHFQVGINLSGISRPGVDKNILCSHNIVDCTNDGIMFWANTFKGFDHEWALDGVHIINNILRLRPNVSPYKRKSSRGIFLFGGKNSTGCSDLKISDNSIIYPQDSEYFDKRRMSSSFTGIGWSLKDNTTPINRVVISNNSIVNAPRNAIRAKGGAVSELVVSGNVVSHDNGFNVVPRVATHSLFLIDCNLYSGGYFRNNTYSSLSSVAYKCIYEFSNIVNGNKIEIAGNNYNIATIRDITLVKFKKPVNSVDVFFDESISIDRDDKKFPTLTKTAIGRIHSTLKKCTYNYDNARDVWLSEQRVYGKPTGQGVAGDVAINTSAVPGDPLSWHFDGRAWRAGPKLLS